MNESLESTQERLLGPLDRAAILHIAGNDASAETQDRNIPVSHLPFRVSVLLGGAIPEVADAKVYCAIKKKREKNSFSDCKETSADAIVTRSVLASDTGYFQFSS